MNTIDFKEIGNHWAIIEWDRSVKRGLRTDLASWQRAVAGLFAFGVVVNTAQCGVIRSRDAAVLRSEQCIAEWEQRYYTAASAEREAVQAYSDLQAQVEQEQAERADQAAAYESLSGYQYIGECTITAYCPCKECCGRWADGLTATGLPAVPGVVAVDPEVIELGSTVIIGGQKYLAADTGSGVTGNHIDICRSTHDETVAFGVQEAEVWVVTE